jgi:hypothetical protein
MTDSAPWEIPIPRLARYDTKSSALGKGRAGALAPARFELTLLAPRCRGERLSVYFSHAFEADEYLTTVCAEDPRPATAPATSTWPLRLEMRVPSSPLLSRALAAPT